MSHPVGTLVRMELVEGFVVGTAYEPVVSRPVFDGLALVQAGVAKLLHNDLEPGDIHEALVLIDEFERLGRQLDAAKLRLHESVDRTGVYAVDGHRGAKPMIANAGKLSGPEAAARQKTMKVLQALPLVAEAFRGGDIATCMVNKLGRVYSNPRVRDFMGEADSWFLSHALSDSYELFDVTVSEWERLADEDGADQKDKRHERARNHQLYQDEDGQWHWKGQTSACDGAISKDVFDAFEKVEFDIDWQWAKDTYGDDANSTHMPRTAAQRRADAFAKIHVYAAKQLAADGGPAVTTDIVIDDETFERETARLVGENVPADDPQRDDYACHTMSGARLHARSVVARALLGALRRNVIGADGVTIDLGRRRVFNGYARIAAKLNASECYWPGCHVNVNNCQIDHLTPYSNRDGPGGPDPGGGLTNPHNGAPACGKHNRHKERGYTVTRLPDGTIEIRRPDGTILT